MTITRTSLCGRAFFTRSKKLRLGTSLLGLVSCSLPAALPAEVVQIGGISLTIPEDFPTSPTKRAESSTSSSADAESLRNSVASREAEPEILVLNGAEKGDAGGVLILKTSVDYPRDSSRPPVPMSELPHRFSVGANVGLPTFFGASLGWRFADHFGVRSGFDWFTFSRSAELSDVTYDVKLKMQSEPLLLDLYPWKNRSFRISAGVLFNQNQLKAQLTPSSLITLGQDTYLPADVGTLHLRVKQRPVCPMFTLGGNLFHFDSAHHWALAGELGAFFSGKPKVQLRTTSTDPLVIGSVADEQRKIEEDIGNRLSIIPVLKLGVNFSF